jgi:hypothetical protein
VQASLSSTNQKYAPLSRILAFTPHTRTTNAADLFLNDLAFRLHIEIPLNELAKDIPPVLTLIIG